MTEVRNDFTALYLPARPPHRPDPSRSGFASREAAEEYISTQVCADCRAQRELPDGFDPCYYEWLIVPTEAVEASETFADLIEAAGGKKFEPS